MNWSMIKWILVQSFARWSRLFICWCILHWLSINSHFLTEFSTSCGIKYFFESGQGKVHNWSHLCCRTLVEVPRSLGEHLQQHAHRRCQRWEWRGQQGQEPGHRKLRIGSRGMRTTKDVKLNLDNNPLGWDSPTSTMTVLSSSRN